MCTTSNAVIPNVHLYPSFEEIEHGIYPSFADTGTLLKLGQTYTTIFHGYFSPGCNSFTTLDYLRQTNSRCNSSFDCPISESEKDVSQEVLEQPTCTSDIINSAEEVISHQVQEESPIPNLTSFNDEFRSDKKSGDEPQVEEIEEISTDRNFYQPALPPPPGFSQTQFNVTNFFNSFMPRINTTASSCELAIPNQQLPRFQYYPSYPVNPIQDTVAASFNACLTNPLLLQQMYMQHQTTVLQQEQIRLQIRQYQQTLEFGRLQQMINNPAAIPPSGMSLIYK